MQRKYFYSSVIGLALLTTVFGANLLIVAESQRNKNHSISSRLSEFGDSARRRWKPYFEQSQIAYPPKAVTLVGFKEDKQLSVYATSLSGESRLIRSFEVCAASGVSGPKLREGDFQVPEGIYAVTFLNPNSAYHVSLRLNYPNSFDKAHAALDGRINLGGDIMIHGKCASIGCLAMQDPSAEDLFVLAADVGIKNIKVILAPFDLRVNQPSKHFYAQMPEWTPELYSNIKAELNKLPNL